MKNYTPIDDLVKKFKEKKESTFFVGKETEPIIIEPKKEVFEVQEIVEKEPSVEVRPYVEVKKEAIEIDEELKKAGLQPVSGSIKFPDYRSLKFPISDEKVLEGLHAPVNSSLRWLAEFIVYILKKFHIQLKKVHGKVVRVLVK